ncbi:unnamed protein product [Lota lota]
MLSCTETKGFSQENAAVEEENQSGGSSYGNHGIPVLRLELPDPTPPKENVKWLLQPLSLLQLNALPRQTCQEVRTLGGLLSVFRAKLPGILRPEHSESCHPAEIVTPDLRIQDCKLPCPQEMRGILCGFKGDPEKKRLASGADVNLHWANSTMCPKRNPERCLSWLNRRHAGILRALNQVNQSTRSRGRLRAPLTSEICAPSLIEATPWAV